MQKNVMALNEKIFIYYLGNTGNIGYNLALYYTFKNIFYWVITVIT